MNRYEKYLYDQFKKLKYTEYGFKIKISDGQDNTTNWMDLTPNRAKDILKILEEKNNEPS
jgi:hypothetical protein